jgi:hypothetical protein
VINDYSVDKKLIERIEVSHLKHYLIDRGWKAEPFGRKEVLKFRSPQPIKGSKYFEILIPSERDLIDYIQVVTTALKGISIYERRSLQNIISQILVSGDLFKFYISTMSTKNGNIPLKEGLPLYDSISNLLIFSACAELFPEKRAFPKKLKAATDFAESCMIAPSNYGSFVANILCPLPSKESQGVAFDEYPPLQRRSVIRILRGLNSVVEAVEIDSPNPIVEKYKTGLNANMCEALLEIMEITKGNDLRVQASLSPSWVIPSDISTEISLVSSSMDYLIAASTLFNEQAAKNENIILIGLALKLVRNPKEEDKERTIQLITSIEGIGVKTVTVLLDEISYRKVVDAHRDIKFISIRGNLEKIKNRWYLTNPRELEIIGDLDPRKASIDPNLEHIMKRTIKRKIEPNLDKKIDSF